MSAQEAMAIAAAVKPLLAGKPPTVQGAVLAELLSLWLAGHVVPGDPAATAALRADLLARHCRVVRDLVPENARLIGTNASGR